ncbi:MAG: B12-binding domain-containing radical SAM protein [Elusimicrobiales bacterium]|nr:B12-binding domain-containing radical SAM protein [Elusimicrobiales bacterium]
MKILLLNPPAGTSLSSTLPDKYTSVEIGYYPPLGLMYLAGYLRARTAHTAVIADMVAQRLVLGDLAGLLERHRPDAVGVYSASATANSVYKICARLKELAPTLPVIVGGPHADIFPAETVAWPAVDYVVRGEGELTLAELLDRLAGGGDPAGVAGVYSKKDGVAVSGGDRPPVADLDELPFPARDLTEYKKYHSAIGKDKVATTLMTSRGCPYRCNFCFVQYGGRYRARSAANVLAEIEECLKLGIREFFFFDEIFTVDKKRVLAICDEIVRRKLDITFEVRSRINTMDAEMLAALKKAGCERISYGVESACDEVLKAMNKRITAAQAREVTALTQRAGIEVFLDFMLGYPGETREQMLRTMAFARELDPDYVQFAITVLIPGTTIYDEALASGQLKSDFWREVAKNPPDLIVPPLASDKYGREFLEEMFRKAYRGFYFRPAYVLKRLKKISSLTELGRHIKGAFQLFRDS